MQDPLLTSAKDLLNGPRVSVGIPCYNRPQGLHAMLECVRHQTYKNLEIIVSDNCSPDEQIPKMMAEFVHADKRIQYFRQEKNVGPTSNFNFVRSKASGEYFVWAADDDAWKETYIEKCLEQFQAHPSLVITSRICLAKIRFSCCFSPYMVRLAEPNRDCLSMVPASQEHRWKILCAQGDCKSQISIGVIYFCL